MLRKKRFVACNDRHVTIILKSSPVISQPSGHIGHQTWHLDVHSLKLTVRPWKVTGIPKGKAIVFQIAIHFAGVNSLLVSGEGNHYQQYVHNDQKMVHTEHLQVYVAPILLIHSTYHHRTQRIAKTETHICQGACWEACCEAQFFTFKLLWAQKTVYHNDQRLNHG